MLLSEYDGYKCIHIHGELVAVVQITYKDDPYEKVTGNICSSAEDLKAKIIWSGTIDELERVAEEQKYIGRFHYIAAEKAVANFWRNRGNPILSLTIGETKLYVGEFAMGWDDNSKINGISFVFDKKEAWSLDERKHAVDIAKRLNNQGVPVQIEWFKD